MSKTWETPKVLVEEFEENEYVAACWGVKCDIKWANKNMNCGRGIMTGE